MADKIPVTDLVPMDLFRNEPIKIDIVYADAAHPQNIFKTALYRKDARLTLHKDLARIVVAVARDLYARDNSILLLKDGLRTIEGQTLMNDTQIVKDNPQWVREPGRLISPPGVGAHPRGMAIDVSLETKEGTLVDMGTVFDEMTEASARDYQGFDPHILQNRTILEEFFMKQAARLNLPMLPLPSEWWDFRFPRSHYEQWAPLSDADLPPALKMIAPQQEDHIGEWASRFDKNAQEVLNSL